MAYSYSNKALSCPSLIQQNTKTQNTGRWSGLVEAGVGTSTVPFPGGHHDNDVGNDDDDQDDNGEFGDDYHASPHQSAQESGQEQR